MVRQTPSRRPVLRRLEHSFPQVEDVSPKTFRIPYYVQRVPTSWVVATTLVLTNLSLLLASPVSPGQSSQPSSFPPPSSVVAVSSPNVLNTLTQYPVPAVQASTDLPTRLVPRNPVPLHHRYAGPPPATGPNPPVQSFMDMPVRPPTWRDRTVTKTIDTRQLASVPFPQVTQPNPILATRQTVPFHHRYAGQPVALLPGTPFYQNEHPNPVPRSTVARDYTWLNPIIFNTIGVAPVKPFAAQEFSNPIKRAFPYINRYNRVVANLEPFNLDDWPNPIVSQRYVYNLTWLQNQIFNTANVPTVFPVVNNDYPNPVPPVRVNSNLTWLQNQVFNTADLVLPAPFSLKDQPNPRGPFRPDGTWVQAIGIDTLPTLPAVQVSLDLPPGSFQPLTWRDRTYTNSVDLDTLANVHTLAGTPFYQTEFPNPVLNVPMNERSWRSMMDLDALLAGTPAPLNQHRLFIDLDTGHLIWRVSGGP